MSVFKNIFLIGILSISVQSFSQDASAQIHQEINETVWKLFCESYASLDVETYNAVHTNDVIRATPWGIRIGEEFKNHNVKGFKANKEKGTQRTIELWFEHRKSTPQISYEVGYYKVTYQKDGETTNHYGRFHCVIKKIDGVWKIAQDWDTNNINGHEVTEKDWEKGTPLVFE